MIDWQNVVIGIVFVFAGIGFVISALRYYLQTSFGKYVLVASAGLAFFLIGGNLILNSPIEFNPTLHECTEWKCPATYDGLELADEDSDSDMCYYWRQHSSSDSFYIKTPLLKSEVNFDNGGKCVSFRAKTECEKGNPEYVQYGISCSKKTPCEKGNSNYVSENLTKDITVCREKSVEELERDYCRLNASDENRCYCSQYEVLPSLQVVGYSIEEINYRLSWGWIDRYGNENFAGKIINRSEITWKENLPLYKWDVSNPDGSGFGGYQPVSCVSAVPLSEKLYCDKNPNDYGKCNCKEGKTEVERYDFVEMTKTFQNEQDYFNWSEQGRYSFSAIYTFVDGASGLIQIPVEEQPDLIDYLLDFKTKVHDIKVRYYEKTPINITTCIYAEPKVEVRDVGDFGVLSEEWNLSDTSNDYVREDWGAEISGEIGFDVFDFQYKVYTGSVQSLLDVLISVEKKDSFYIVSNESFLESFDWDTSILQSGNYNYSLKNYDIGNIYIEGEPYEDCTETYDECSIIGNTSRYKCITKEDSSGCVPRLRNFKLYYPIQKPKVIR